MVVRGEFAHTEEPLPTLRGAPNGVKFKGHLFVKERGRAHQREDLRPGTSARIFNEIRSIFFCGSFSGEGEKELAVRRALETYRGLFTNGQGEEVLQLLLVFERRRILGERDPATLFQHRVPRCTAGRKG
jgi:hypothetical protein